jgi:tetraacyldisaccharide 4'-kinase
MRAPVFWWQGASTPLSVLLAPAAALYGAVAARRMARPGQRAGVPVICIGNFTAGGAGKTPTALAVARLLSDAGERPFFLTRGYGGRLAGPVRVAAAHGAKEVGDEPLLLARAAPTIVSRDRPAGARLAAAAGASVIVMDDGLQNPSLEKDLALAVVDGASGLGNGRVIPAGPLRAPMAAQWPHVQAVAIVGAGAAGEALAREAATRGLPVLRARLVPDAAVAAQLRGVRVLAFSGIGRPEKFAESLGACGAHVEEVRVFPDHHVFTPAELAEVEAQASRRGLLLVTTEKDAARAARPDWTVLPVRLEADDAAAFRALVLSALTPRLPEGESLSEGGARATSRSPRLSQTRPKR